MAPKLPQQLTIDPLHIALALSAESGNEDTDDGRCLAWACRDGTDGADGNMDATSAGCKGNHTQNKATTFHVSTQPGQTLLHIF